MSASAADRPTEAGLSFFERYLTLWVALCIVAGIVLGQLLPAPFQAIGAMEVARVNLPVGVLIWVMIIPMLLKIDFGALGQVKRSTCAASASRCRELAGEAVLDGAAGLDLHPPRLRAVAAGGTARQLHRGPDPARRPRRARRWCSCGAG